jgi:hypothetical protein
MQITASERRLHGQIMHAHIDLTHQVTKKSWMSLICRVQHL